MVKGRSYLCMRKTLKNWCVRKNIGIISCDSGTVGKGCKKISDYHSNRKRNNTKAEELLYELIDSKTVLPCYNSTNPRVSLTDTKDFDSYKLYLSDTGLFVTLMFIDRPVTEMIFMRSYFPINYRQIWDIFMRIWLLKWLQPPGENCTIIPGRKREYALLWGGFPDFGRK